MSAATFLMGFDPLPQARELGLTPTSGYRTQSHQDSLRAQGLTKTEHSAHTRGDAYDFAVPQGMSKTEAIAQSRKRWPGARIEPSNGNAIHVTFPGWGGAQDVSGSRRRYGG